MSQTKRACVHISLFNFSIRPTGRARSLLELFDRLLVLFILDNEDFNTRPIIGVFLTRVDLFSSKAVFLPRLNVVVLADLSHLAIRNRPITDSYIAEMSLLMFAHQFQIHGFA